MKYVRVALVFVIVVLLISACGKEEPYFTLKDFSVYDRKLQKTVNLFITKQQFEQIYGKPLKYEGTNFDADISMPVYPDDERVPFVAFKKDSLIGIFVTGNRFEVLDHNIKLYKTTKKELVKKYGKTKYINGDPYPGTVYMGIQEENHPDRYSRFDYYPKVVLLPDHKKVNVENMITCTYNQLLSVQIFFNEKEFDQASPYQVTKDAMVGNVYFNHFLVFEGYITN